MESIRTRVDQKIYKEESNAAQRQEANGFALAVYHNSGIDEHIDHDIRPKVKTRLLYEIERSALCLILERDDK